MQLRKTYRFEASHILPVHPGKCSNLHGHSWVLHVFVEGAVDPNTGFVMDYADISKVVKPLVEKLDHRHLGCWDDTKKGYSIIGLKDLFGVEGMYIYPSSENLLWWIGEQLHSRPGDIRLNWSKLAIEETCTSYCELTREEFDGRRDSLPNS